MLYVYAISDSPHCPPGAGVRDAALSATGEAGVFAVVSEHEEVRVRVDEASLWAHETVVEALLDRGPVLPMRFGSTIADRDQLLALLRRRRDEFRAGLERVRGAVELAVRALARGGPEHVAATRTLDGDAGPGTAYMLARLEEERRAEAMGARINEPLEALARASRPTMRSSGRALVNAAYLVEREMVESFRARVAELDAELSDATVVSTGPWPPYSFTAEVER